MTFRLFNALSEFFKANPAEEIYLRDCGFDGEWCTRYVFNVDDDIMWIDEMMDKSPMAELFVFDGHTYAEFLY